MNKNLPVELWDMIEVERRRAFKRRVEEFEVTCFRNICWKKSFFYDNVGCTDDQLAREFNNLLVLIKISWGYFGRKHLGLRLNPFYLQ